MRTNWLGSLDLLLASTLAVSRACLYPSWTLSQLLLHAVTPTFMMKNLMSCSFALSHPHSPKSARVHMTPASPSSVDPSTAPGLATIRAFRSSMHECYTWSYHDKLHKVFLTKHVLLLYPSLSTLTSAETRVDIRLHFLPYPCARS